MAPRRVVITGMGTISPLGNSYDEFWTRLIAGQSGIGLIERFDTSNHPAKIAAEVKDFKAQDYMPRAEARRMDLFIQYGCAATRVALEDAALDVKTVDLDRTGVIVGSGIGGLETYEKQHNAMLKKGVNGVSPFFIPMLIPNMAAGHISIMFGPRGPASCSVTACATATNCIGDAFRLIKYGITDVMISGGTEAPITPLSIAGFCAMKALSTHNEFPEKACRPFDIDRNGFVMGEGAAVLILEEMEHALNRGAKIYAELTGYGSSADANHIVQPDPEGYGAAKALEYALIEADMKPEQIDHINAHGTGTMYNDIIETKALKKVFGAHSYDIAVNSTKAATGHMMGAAGAIELIAATGALCHNLVPPTLNLENPDPQCDLNYVRGKARTHIINAAASESLGFGGHNAALIIKKWG